MNADLVFDLLLAAALLWSAWRTLATPDIFRAVILFIVFGLLMTLAWLGKCPQFARQLPLLTPPALDNDVHV